jgi:hypothetical protein
MRGGWKFLNSHLPTVIFPDSFQLRDSQPQGHLVIGQGMGLHGCQAITDWTLQYPASFRTPVSLVRQILEPAS